MGTKSEFFKNQKQTQAIAELTATQQNSAVRQKVLVLKLNAREQKALDYLGGAEALKQLLCPAGVCLACRQNPVHGESDLCEGCLGAGR